LMHGAGETLGLPNHSAWNTASRRKSRTIDLAALELLDREDCIERWWQMFGVAPPKYTSLEFMRKVLSYEAQVRAFGEHSNAVQRVLKASLKPIQRKAESGSSVDVNDNDHAPTGSASCVERQGVVVRTAPDAYQPVQHNNTASDACDQTSIKGRGRIAPSAIARARSMADSNTDASKVTNSTRTAKSNKPSVLSIRAGTHLVREWNGRTYQVEALENGFRLDGKTYRSLSAIAKKITGAHWSGPRFFGLES
jgi:hypothetical protein